MKNETGEWLNVRRRKPNCGKSRKLTADVFKSLWQNLSQGVLNKPGCSNCTGGYIRHPKPDGFGFVFEDCACLVEYESLCETIKLWKQSNIGMRLITRYKLDDWQEPTEDGLTFDALLAMVDAEDSKWPFLWGGTGSGKTFAAILIAQIAMLREKTVFFTNVAELLDALRPSADNTLVDGMAIKDIYTAKANRANILILDDIGQEKSSEWVRERLFLIINERWNAGKMTVLTSNFDIEHIKTTISPAVYSRIKGESLEIHLSGLSDRRLT